MDDVVYADGGSQGLDLLRLSDKTIANVSKQELALLKKHKSKPKSIPERGIIKQGK